nr:Chain C, Puckered [synthetic construct]3HQL_D Chain D, Puckered [synthetic construct]
ENLACDEVTSTTSSST